jgi:hypothetical protein
MVGGLCCFCEAWTEIEIDYSVYSIKPGFSKQLGGISGSGEPAEIIFDRAPTSYQFLSDHRIRITFSGADTSNFAALPGPAPTWATHPAAPAASFWSAC